MSSPHLFYDPPHIYLTFRQPCNHRRPFAILNNSKKLLTDFQTSVSEINFNKFKTTNINFFFLPKTICYKPKCSNDIYNQIKRN